MLMIVTPSRTIIEAASETAIYEYCRMPLNALRQRDVDVGQNELVDTKTAV